MPDLIRVVVVDDQALFASGLAMLIDAQDDMECVATAVDGREALAVVEASRPDVVLMDLRMPGMNGLEATRALLERGTAEDPPRIVVLTTLRRDEVVAQALEAGASAFLTKDATPEQVLTTIRDVHAGDVIPDLKATMKLVAELGGSTRPRRDETLAALSPREREVFLLLARGLTNAEIAETAWVSEATVKTHIGAILRKLGLRSRVQVVVFAHQNNLVVTGG